MLLADVIWPNLTPRSRNMTRESKDLRFHDATILLLISAIRVSEVRKCQIHAL